MIGSMAFDGFDDLYVISDLHLGGRSGHQIFDQGVLAAALVNHLADLPAERRIGLIVNGDLVDFLAEPAATWFDPEGAAGKLERIASDPAFEPVFSSFRRFTSTPGRTLVITLGNHDLELSLPWVREKLLGLLSGDDAAARGRVRLAFEGTGYRCRVADAPILCVHGNEVDAWNVTDFERLRRIGRDTAYGRVPERWKPNAGARMVVEVMNEIKARHPFVDLLKPETEAVVPALVVLEPQLAGKIAAVVRVALRKKWDAVRMQFGFLSAPGRNATRGNPPESSPEAVMQVMLGAAATSGHAYLDDVLRSPLDPTADGGQPIATLTAGKELLAAAERHLAEGRQPLEFVATAGPADKLGWASAVRAWVSRRGQSEVLRAALDGLRADARTFALGDWDETARRLNEIAAPCIRFVIAGHTHLRRALERPRGGGFYYNTGTWVRLIRIPPDHISTSGAFDATFAALKAKTLGELDALNYVIRQATVVHITAGVGGALGELFEAKLDAQHLLTLTALPETRFPRQ